jgi:hypothetical protein
VNGKSHSLVHCIPTKKAIEFWRGGSYHVDTVAFRLFKNLLISFGKNISNAGSLNSPRRIF